jgi:choline dehydrogenase-like flavoprotein
MDIERTHWDVIVIGTGMGGATIGYALARQGKKVLFCEKGKSLLQPDQGLRGNFAETFFPAPEAPSTFHRETLLDSGRYAEEIVDASTRFPQRHIPFIGQGTGGSSAIYGAALERFYSEDFRPREHHPKADGSSVPESWPITYEQLRPCYDEAEALFRVRGTQDPCATDKKGRRLTPPPG